MEKRRHSPPLWADRFLEWYCNPLLLEEIQGDAYELFQRRAGRGARRAKLLFVWDVLRFFRWRNIRKERLKNYPEYSAAMLRSYFITGFRNMLRNATPSLINITGLSIAIGCAVLIFILEDSYYNLDAMHEKGDRIGLVVNRVQEGDGQVRNAMSPYSLASLLRENSAVESVVRLSTTGAAVRNGEKVFNERIHFADPSFSDVFSFRVVEGDRNCLADKNQVMLSEEMAVKYFGTSRVSGQALSIKFSDQHRLEFTIGAVLENTPANSSMYIDFVVSTGVWEDLHRELAASWAQGESRTFVLLHEGKSFEQLAPTIKAYTSNQNKAEAVRQVKSCELIPMTRVAEESGDIAGSLSWSNHPAAMIAFAVIGSFLVLLACFNYMNVAVASVTTRLREIGVRKVVGGSRNTLIFQFLTENLLLCSIALVTGTALAYFFLVPGFDALYPVKIDFEVSSWQMVAGFFGGLLVFVSLVSGAYPALYISSFNTLKILRGKEKFGSKSKFSKVLLTLQFTLSITTIVGCLVFVWAGNYFEDKDWGYDPANIIAVKLQDGKQFEAMRTAVAGNKGVVSYAGSVHHAGHSNTPAVITVDQKDYGIMAMHVGFNYAESMNLRLKEGRFFSEEISSDQIENAVVNERFARKMGWNSPIGKHFEYEGKKRFVVGVVNDFHYRDFYWATEPLVMTIAPQENFRYLVVKADGSSRAAVEESLKNKWKTIAPDDPYDAFSQDTVFDNFRTANSANNKVILFVSLVALVLAAMGLYGLISYNLTRRLKEYSVRKVFGATTGQIFGLMNGDYLGIVLVSCFAGAPLGAWLMDMLIRAAYPDKVPATAWPYVIAVSVIFLTVAVTILTQLRRVVKENPSETLRIE